MCDAGPHIPNKHIHLSICRCSVGKWWVDELYRQQPPGSPVWWCHSGPQEWRATKATELIGDAAAVGSSMLPMHWQSRVTKRHHINFSRVSIHFYRATITIIPFIFSTCLYGNLLSTIFSPSSSGDVFSIGEQGRKGHKQLFQLCADNLSRKYWSFLLPVLYWLDSIYFNGKQSKLDDKKNQFVKKKERTHIAKTVNLDFS